MFLELTEQQQAYRDMARDFAEREIRPIAAKLDRIEDVTQIFPWELVKKGSKIGLRTLTFPQEYGGQNADLLTQVVVIDELAFADSACAKIFSQVWKASSLIIKAGTKDQRDRFLPAIRDDDTCVLSIAQTEPNAGTDNVLPFDDPKGGLMLSARREGDDYVLNGTKHYISLGDVSKLLVVAARTDRTVGIVRGASWFIVPKNTPGLSVGRVQDKVGWRVYTNAELVFDNVRVPGENLLGGLEGLAHAAAGRQGQGEMEVSAHCLAMARAAYEASLSFARQRVQGGKPIIEHQPIAMILGEMYVDLESARTYLWHTARLFSQGKAEPASGPASFALAQGVLERTITGAMVIHGGVGVMKDMPIEKLRRDSLIFLHGGGARYIQLIKTCRRL